PARLGGAQEPGIELHLISHGGCEAALQLVEAEKLSAVERVDDEFSFREPHLAEEMAGKADALDIQPAALPHLDVDDAERERDARASIEHLVEEAVARIVVVVVIAAEAQLVEEVRVDPADAALRRGSRRQSRLDAFGQ